MDSLISIKPPLFLQNVRQQRPEPALSRRSKSKQAITEENRSQAAVVDHANYAIKPLFILPPRRLVKKISFIKKWAIHFNGTVDRLLVGLPNGNLASILPRPLGGLILNSKAMFGKRMNSSPLPDIMIFFLAVRGPQLNFKAGIRLARRSLSRNRLAVLKDNLKMLKLAEYF
ncbi:MAG TPA: hypothetical protein PLR31_09835 [Anaerohalosphaeraceae bacterium]|nr:hypothetical protein [Anaerohalosphaeraceae bacterium]